MRSSQKIPSLLLDKQRGMLAERAVTVKSLMRKT